MNDSPPLPTTPSKTKSGLGLFFLGGFLAFLGIALYFAQLHWKRLSTPWYLPVVGTIAYLCVLASVVRSRTVLRVASLLFVGLLMALEWYFLLSFSKLPVYVGPVVAGQPMPTFTTLRADGTLFTQDNLKGAQNTVLVFFRGRW